MRVGGNLRRVGDEFFGAIREEASGLDVEEHDAVFLERGVHCCCFKPFIKMNFGINF